MAISRLVQTTLQNGFEKYNQVWDGRSAVGSMEAISSITLSAAQTSIEFNNIPGTYSHLQIRNIARITASQDRDSIKLQFNSDTGSNYARHSLWGSGSAASAYGNAPDSYVLLTDFAAATATASIYGAAVTDILDYANTNKYKTVRSLGGVDLNAAVTVYDGLNSGHWRNTNAITSITLTPYTGSSFAQYSSFTLYGIK